MMETRDACVDHLFQISIQPAQADVLHAAQRVAPGIGRMLARDAAYCGTVFDGEEIVMMSGIHEYEHHGEAWTFLARNVGSRMTWVMREVMAYLLKFSLTGKPVYATVEPGSREATRWLRMLGFAPTDKDDVWCFMLKR
jgi:hypothetical protein